MQQITISFSENIGQAALRLFADNLNLQLALPKITGLAYIDDTERLQEVAHSNIYINNGVMNNQTVRDILYALLHNIPIVLYDLPAFSDDIHPFAKEIINQKLSKFLIVNIGMLDSNDRVQFLLNATAEPCNYVLTKHQRTLIAASLRTHFRRLVCF